jgi:hypothetical protein
MRIAPHVPAPALAVVAVLAVLAALAGVAQAWPAAVLLGVAGGTLGARLAWESGIAVSWLERCADPEAQIVQPPSKPLVPETE